MLKSIRRQNQPEQSRSHLCPEDKLAVIHHIIIMSLRGRFFAEAISNTDDCFGGKPSRNDIRYHDITLIPLHSMPSKSRATTLHSAARG